MRKILLTLSFSILLFLTSLAQNVTVKGRVISVESGEPVSGASVRVKGNTKIGISTDARGEFSLSIPLAAKTLVVSGVGYVSKDVGIGKQTSFQIELTSTDQTLDDVVVVGYGTTTKETYTGSVKSVDLKSFNGKAQSNISQALAGEAAGVNVINTTGQPGSSATIRIRGFGSVNGNRDPLYVLDGVPYTGNINAINMDDIAAVSVLKDAVATSIYGARGANGVVLLTTKSGRGDKPYIEFDSRLGRNLALLPNYDVINSPETYIELGWKGLYNQAVAQGDANPTAFANDNLFGAGQGIVPHYNMWNVANGGELIDPGTGKVRGGVTRKYSPENWRDYAFQPALRSENNLKMGGGNEKTSYFTSVGYLTDKGYSINSNFERLSARLNINHNPTEWLNSSMNIGYANSTTNNNGQSEDSGSVFWFTNNIPSIYPLFLRDDAGTIVGDPIYGGSQYDYGNQGRRFGALTNSISDANLEVNRTLRDEFNGNVKANIKFTDYLTLENTFGGQLYYQTFVNKGNKFYGSSASQGGSLYNDRRKMLTYNALNLLRFKKRFGNHNVEAFAAHEANFYSLNILTLSKNNLVDPDILDFNNAIINQPISSYTSRAALESYFANVNYDYQGKYFLSASIRRDGSSRFLDGKRWANFGSVGASWLVSKESFMENQNFFTSLKYRISYGLTGEQSGVGFYPGYDLFNVDNLNDNPAFSFNTKGNPDLTWEKAQMFQTGVDFDIKNYISATFDFYQKNTTNLLFERRVGPSLGYALLNVNDGRLRNRGFEFDITGHILNTQDYFLDLGVNGTFLNNKLTRMPVDPATGMQKILDVQSLFGRSVGRSIYDFYMREWAGVDAQTGEGQWTAYYYDANGDGQPNDGEYVPSLTQYQSDFPDRELSKTTTKVYNNATLQYVNKSSIPKVSGAINLRGGYKGFSLSVQFLYSLGGYAYDGAYAGLMDNGFVGANNWHMDMLNSWSAPGDMTNIPRLSSELDQNVASASSRFLTKSNTLGLNNVRLSYTFPQKLIQSLKMQNLNIWLSGDNLWYTTKRRGFYPTFAQDDPTNIGAAGRSSTYQYYPTSNISLGLSVKF